MVGVLTEQKFIKTFWGQQILFSLVARLKEKRIQFEMLDIRTDCVYEAVFVVASNYEWTQTAITQLNVAGYYPILLCNQSENLPGCMYSCVCTDINLSMKALLDTLYRKHKKRVAIYGVNPHSIADLSRVNHLFLWSKTMEIRLKIFENDTSLADCFERFYKEADAFDAVICVNDYAAVSLVRRWKGCTSTQKVVPEIISCAQTRMAQRYKDDITTLNINFEQYGKAAVYAYETLRKREYLSSVTLHVAYTMEQQFATVKQPFGLCLPDGETEFYEDDEFRDMLVADRLLDIDDVTDQRILSGLAHNETYDTIATACYLTEGSVKYRIKRILQTTGCNDKAQLIAVLKKYVL